MSAGPAPRPRLRVPTASLRQTEDALLDMHQECKISRQALRRQAEQLRHAHEAAERHRGVLEALQRELGFWRAHSDAIETIYGLELRQIEREMPTGAGEAKLRRQIDQLRDVASEAVTGMQEAKAECEWLYEQLRRAVQPSSAEFCGGLDVGNRSRTSDASPAADKTQDDSTDPQSASLLTRLGSLHGPEGGDMMDRSEDTLKLVARDKSALEAARADFARAVQRCHAVQVHMAACADREAELLPELHQAHRRVADLTAEVDELRRKLSSPLRSTPLVAATSLSAAGEEHRCAHGIDGIDEAAGMVQRARALSPPSGFPVQTSGSSERGLGEGEIKEVDAAEELRAATAAVDITAHAVASWLEEPLSPIPDAEVGLYAAAGSHPGRLQAASGQVRTTETHRARPPLGFPARISADPHPLKERNVSFQQGNTHGKLGAEGGLSSRRSATPRDHVLPSGSKGKPKGAYSVYDCPYLGNGDSSNYKRADTETVTGSRVDMTNVLREENRRLLAALSAESSRRINLESELAARRAAHQQDLKMLSRAREEAAEAARALREQGEWVRALDAMRISDLRTIQQLENRLECAARLIHPPSRNAAPEQRRNE